MARPQPNLTGVLPPRYYGTEWQPPCRRDEEEELRLASPQAIVELLRPLLDERRAARLDEVAASRLGGVVVVLEDLHDPHNGGAVLRSCEAMGIREVNIIASRERFRVSEKVTQGADKWLDVLEHKSTEAALSTLRQRGFRLAAAVPGVTTQLTDLDPRAPTALLMGNEHAGLTKEARAFCDVEAASLNADSVVADDEAVDVDEGIAERDAQGGTSNEFAATVVHTGCAEIKGSASA